MDTVMFFRALGDQHRQVILRLLRDADEISVSELCQELPGLSQPTVSHHLHVLRQCCLVERRKVGKVVFYQLNRVAFHMAGQTLYDEWCIEHVE
jgi:ArsR family transcriptional regulator, arsenate/arsenite/antimonite-responsive transcriptional repressor